MIKSIIIKSIGAYLNIAAYLFPKYCTRKSFEIFCTPIRLQLKPEQISFLDTAVNEDVVMSDGNKVRVYKWGNGSKKVLFCHGWQSHSFRWIKYINQLLAKSDYTIYAFDATAHGQSGGKLLNIPLYSQYIEEVVHNYGTMDYYVGHSMGGISILFTFYRLKEWHAKGIVILASPGNAMDFVHQYRDILGMNERALELLLQNFEDRFSLAPEFFRSDEFAKSLEIPGLIIHDKEDPETPYHYAQKLNNVWKNSTLITTEGLGHKMRSDEVVDMVLEFMI